jgi:hypothetical protein
MPQGSGPKGRTSGPKSPRTSGQKANAQAKWPKAEAQRPKGPRAGAPGLRPQAQRPRANLRVGDPLYLIYIIKYRTTYSLILIRPLLIKYPNS